MKKKIRIAVCGSFSVGKTTLVNKLLETLAHSYNVVVHDEIALKLLKRGYLMSKDITEYGLINYANEALENVKNKRGDIFIHDRSLLDLYAYLCINDSSKIRAVYTKLIEQILYFESLQFDFYVYIPIEIPLFSGNSRPTDEEYRANLDKKIIDLLTDFGCNYIIVNGSVEQRENITLKEIFHLIENE